VNASNICFILRAYAVTQIKTFAREYPSAVTCGNFVLAVFKMALMLD